jgi:hypothetical protein
MFYLISLLVCYIGVLTSFAKPLPVTIELECSGYDEVLVNGRCEISLDKIPVCPGTVAGDVCITELNQ